MGFVIDMTDAHLVLPGSRRPAAYQALKGAEQASNVWGRGLQSADHKNLLDALDWYGFDFHEDGEGGTITITGYSGKSRMEDEFTQALTPFWDVETGTPFSCWLGEDGSTWRDILINGEWVRQEGRVVYGDPEPESPAEQPGMAMLSFGDETLGIAFEEVEVGVRVTAWDKSYEDERVSYLVLNEELGSLANWIAVVRARKEGDLWVSIGS